MRDTSLKIEIRNILSDGTVVPDISKVKVASDHPVYRVLKEVKHDRDNNVLE
jgi:hypothetical protein